MRSLTLTHDLKASVIELEACSIIDQQLIKIERLNVPTSNLNLSPLCTHRGIENQHNQRGNPSYRTVSLRNFWAPDAEDWAEHTTISRISSTDCYYRFGWRPYKQPAWHNSSRDHWSRNSSMTVRQVHNYLRLLRLRFQICNRTMPGHAMQCVWSDWR